MRIDIHVLKNNNDIDRLNSLYINLLGYSLIKLDFIKIHPKIDNFVKIDTRDLAILGAKKVVFWTF